MTQRMHEDGQHWNGVSLIRRQKNFLCNEKKSSQKRKKERAFPLEKDLYQLVKPESLDRLSHSWGNVFCYCNLWLPLPLLQQLGWSSQRVSVLFWHLLLDTPSSACQFHDTPRPFFPLLPLHLDVFDATLLSFHAAWLAIPNL